MNETPLLQKQTTTSSPISPETPQLSTDFRLAYSNPLTDLLLLPRTFPSEKTKTASPHTRQFRVIIIISSSSSPVKAGVGQQSRPGIRQGQFALLTLARCIFAISQFRCGRPREKGGESAVAAAGSRKCRRGTEQF